MADVQPLRTLRYDPDVAGPLEDLIAPPYDVIDDELRAELAARSAHNVVELDLPKSYEAAAETLDEWRRDGVLVQEDEPAIWALRQDYTAPDGSDPLAQRVLRARARGGLRRGPDPAARAHPSGPEGGPAQAHARDAREPLPHLQPLPRSRRRGHGDARPGHGRRAVRRGDRRRGHAQHALASGRPRADRRAPGRARGRGAADRGRPPPLRDRARRTPTRSAARASTATC